MGGRITILVIDLLILWLLALGSMSLLLVWMSLVSVVDDESCTTILRHGTVHFVRSELEISVYLGQNL